MKSDLKADIIFEKLSIDTMGKKQINRIFLVIENGKSTVSENFINLDSAIQNDVKNIIRRIACIKNYRSNKLRWKLKNFDFGEIKPKGHRFFFFKKFGDCIVFFDYKEKKRKGGLKSEVYSQIQKKGKKYEKEFKKYKKQY